jgi:hypothetical protein
MGQFSSGLQGSKRVEILEWHWRSVMLEGVPRLQEELVLHLEHPSPDL